MSRPVVADEELVGESADPRSFAGPMADPRGGEPIRAELFGLEHLEAHARQLAALCKTAPRARAASPLLRRFESNGEGLVAAHRRIVDAADSRDARGLDADWLADNFHVVEDVLREVRHDLPPGYDSELPKLAGDLLPGYPRVYAIALALVAHSDGALDDPRIVRYVAEFQESTPLNIGELWAVPIMLRLVLLENLRRLADRMIRGWDEQRRADAWASAHLPENPPGVEVRTGPADYVELPPPAELTDPFVVRLLQRLHDQGPEAGAILARLGERLAARGDDANEVLRREHRRQAANQVSVGNAVTSIRLLAALEWNAFFEQNSVVEATLRDDPSGVYVQQDFATRDRYRRAVERIARRSGADEREVARRAVELARKGLAEAEGPARGHVGYYLIDRGRARLAGEFRYRAGGGERWLAAALRHPGVVYFGSIAGITLGLLVILPQLGGAIAPGWIMALVVLALAVPAGELAVGLVNHLATLFLPPQVLPKLDFKAGIAEDCPTFVVMPTMLVRPQSGVTLAERLEIHYLSNPDPRLRFALLTDFADAPEEHRPEDDGYVRSTLDAIAALNLRYCAGGPDRFFLFHRRRKHDPVQGCWMGWERKRGKLSEFNRMLLGDKDTTYNVLSGDPGPPGTTRFVITLDADTEMPRDAARWLVGAMAHPLNRARFDPTMGRVVEGYGVLQPRVSYHLTAATRSRFAGLLATSAGIDPYATAVSDAYMDLFGIGTFTGKGIYDLEAFEAATGRTFPQDQILSHDLIEGNYARCGLITDVELFDDFPARYHTYARREHRWVRGDWQLLPWLGRNVPTADGPRRNPLPAAERWKVYDNLRRSLVPPSVVALLVLGWAVLPGSPLYWTLLALLVPSLPVWKQLTGAAVGSIKVLAVAHLVALPRDLLPTIGHALMSIAFLADQARTLVDATGRTLIRLGWTRRNLLEWETAAATEQRMGTDLGHFWRSMWHSPVFAIAVAGLLTLVRPAALPAAAPVLSAWFFSPLLAYWLSRPKRTGERPLDPAERLEMRRVARRTWHFFETFVGPADNWQPPDNFQEIPSGRIAHRTSPTNQGLLLLSTLAAHDLGYLSLPTLLDRLENTFNAFDRLDKYRGHFYNWYDTITLRVLPPGYVSTVDSGNLLGCLVTLKQGLREKAREPIGPATIAQGLADTFAQVVETARAAGIAEGDQVLGRIANLLAEVPADPAALLVRLRELVPAAEAAATRLDGVGAVRGPALDWIARFAVQARSRAEELATIAPWLDTLGPVRPAIPPPAIAPPPPVVARFDAIRDELSHLLDIHRIAQRAEPLKAELAAIASGWPDRHDREATLALIAKLTADIDAGAAVASSSRDRLHLLADRADLAGAAMDFRFLYKDDRHLFSIGYNPAQGRLDDSCYDLIASESALTSFLTIARGDVPRRHWFQLGRPFIKAAGRIGLLSWGGTMFEYLMPRLLLKSLPDTILSEAIRTAVDRQVEYGRQVGSPWGISESGYSAQFADGDYQYQSFGTPGLGLKRGLARDLVIAPYATALAVMVDPRAALANFKRLTTEGGEGAYGFYEAIDYTPDRVFSGGRLVVRSFMAHHQGMSLVALTNALLDEPMPRRFRAEPMVKAAELLLQERLPREVPLLEPSEADAAPAMAAGEPEYPLLSRRLVTPSTPAPRTHLLSNSRYSVMVTGAGGGFSTCRGLDVTRWREDATRDSWGQFAYVRDLTGGRFWSTGYQPVGSEPDDYEVIYSADKATFRRLDAGIETKMEVTVSPEHLAEIRRVTVTNRGEMPRELEITSYVEVVLGSRGGDMAHPAFGKLFLETEWVPGVEALLCRRRPRSPDQPPIWAVHVSATDDPDAGPVQHETDRARFLGRGRSPADPEALDANVALSGTVGAVLDPILSLRRRLRVDPGESHSITFATALADSRAEAIALADQYREASASSRAFELAWAHSQVEHRHRRLSAEDAHLYQRLASHVLFATGAFRDDPETIAANRLGTVDLWRLGISGDRPIILVRLGGPDQVPLARQLLDAHAYLRLKGLEIDLVLLDEQPVAYFEGMIQQLQDLVRSGDARDLVDKSGGVFVRKAAILSEADATLLRATARVVLVGERGGLAAQLDRFDRVASPPEPLRPTEAPSRPVDTPTPCRDDLAFANGLGGFAPGGREYHVIIGPGPAPEVRRNGTAARMPTPRAILPPAPWINVVANPGFGFLASESGLGMTWAGNSQANRLTPWNNDPITDTPAEAVYLRDEATGEIWSPTPSPVPDRSRVVVRHGQGYTAYERRARGLDHELLAFVPHDDPIKIIRLTITNLGDKPRSISATYYAEWVLGTARDQAPMQVIAEIDPESGALFARNSYNLDFNGRIAFVDVDRRPRTLTADRTEFLGRNGRLAAPAALSRVELSGHAGAGLDPCAAVQVKLTLAPGEKKVVAFLLGQADDAETARSLTRRYREPGRVTEALAEVEAAWDRILGAVEVRTPDPAMDLILNRWLPYQTLACRVWGRSALYQSGGAYGFRDQLQDSMALVYGAPAEARAHILRAAGRQFIEGDVQHWWHPPAGRGVRTKISDDYLWLPYVACRYVEATGDAGIFDEAIPFLKGPILGPHQEEDYGLPTPSGEAATLYDHCARALDHGRPTGTHGLPLMGTGDWNDGMNRVGAEGRGESVWVAWFLIAGLKQFAEVADRRGDADRAQSSRDEVERLRQAIESQAWDGDWYRRAYFDDGTPLGSASNTECQIDAIAQTWSLISGAGDPERAAKAMAEVDARLVRPDDGLILLFTPPFDKGTLEPGYIKGYVPGIRENGGQYTHAATWVALAAAIQGRGTQAHALFDILNPIRHAADPAGVARYKVEPYVVAADVYGLAPHTGRGGWTWYTGSSAWLYRVGLEAILGLRPSGDRLELDPCIPASWPGFEVDYRRGVTRHRIVVANPDGVERGVRSATVDGREVGPGPFAVPDDGRDHAIQIVMGSRVSPAG